MKSLEYEYKLLELDRQSNRLFDFVKATCDNKISGELDSDIASSVYKTDFKAATPRSSINSVNRSSFISSASYTTCDSTVSVSHNPSPDIIQMEQSGNNTSNTTAQGIAIVENSDISSAIVDIEPVEAKRCEIPQSKYLNLDLLLGDNRSITQYGKSIDEVLTIIQPHESQLQYRSSAIAFLKKHIRSTLFSNSFEIGVTELKCFLPDDSLKITAIISKSYLTNWHASLLDAFGYLSERGPILAEEEDPSFQLTHSMTNVNYSKHQPSSKSFSVHCTLDSVTIEVVANNRIDQCCIAFFEDLSLLIGQDNLFKRSLLLIRAWWLYETPSYVGCPIKHYLTDHAFIVMVSMIFNLYHSLIACPFQALGIFLAVFSEYDGTSKAISLQGFVSFDSNNIPILSPVESFHLVSESLLEKYRNVFIANQEMHDDLQAIEIGGVALPVVNLVDDGLVTTDPSMDTSMDAKMNTSIDNHSIISEQSNVSMEGRHLISLSLSPQFVPPEINDSAFERSGFNIVNPFDFSNMVVDSLGCLKRSKLE